MTVFGWVGSDPEFHSGQESSGDRATFRLASTPRFFDKSRGGYRDQETVWLGVKTWRALAHNVASSIHKGDPVVVVGRLRAQVYRVEGEERRYQELEATVVGHDLTKGTSMFRRTTRSAQPDSPAPQADPGLAPQAPILRPVGEMAPVATVRSGEEVQPGAA